MSEVMDVDGKRFVALRHALTAMGGHVNWDNHTKTATIDMNGKQTVVTMEDQNASFDGQVLTLSAAPFVKDGTLYVPEDFFPGILRTQMPF
jgi:hypothetical protein